MSNEIDKHEIELVFNNGDFEKHVAESMRTLDKFKSSFSTNAINKAITPLSNALNKVAERGLFKKISDSTTEQLKGSFIAKRRIIENFVDDATAKMKQLFVSMGDMNGADAGWDKYNSKVQNVQSIMNATGKSAEEVSGYLNQLMRFSDETSYSFTNMTSALATMASSGASIDDAIPMIMGVAEATAYAGKTGIEFERVMNNLTQSYSGGFLNLRDWQSVEQANVNSKQLIETLIKAGEDLGKIEKGTVTIENFRDSLSEKWADRTVMEQSFGTWSAMIRDAIQLTDSGKFKTVSDALDAIGGNYDQYVRKATEASQSSKSFSEAIEATKDAVSSGWMQSFEIIFGNYDKALNMWSDVGDKFWELFASGAEQRNDILLETFGNGWDRLKKRITDTGVEFEVFRTALEQVLTGYGNNIADIEAEFGSLEEAFTSGALHSHLLTEAFDLLAKGEVKTAGATEDFSERFVEFQNVVNQVWWGKFGKGEEQIAKLTEAGYDFAFVQRLMDKTATSWSKDIQKGFLTQEEFNEAIEEYNAVQKKAIELTNEQREAMAEMAEESKDASTDIGEVLDTMSKPSGHELLKESLLNLLQVLINLRNGALEVFGALFNIDVSASLYNGLQSFADFTAHLAESTKDCTKFKNAVLSARDTVVKFFAVAKGWASSGYQKMADSLPTVTKVIEDFWHKLQDGYQAVSDYMSNTTVFTDVFSTISDIVGKAAGKLNELYEASKKIPLIGKILETIEQLLSNFMSKDFDFGYIGFNISSGIASGLSSGVQGIIGAIGGIVGTIIKTFCSMLGIASPSKVFIALAAFIVSGIAIGIASGGSEATNAIANVINNLASEIDNPTSPIILSIQNLFNTIKSKFSNVKWANLYVAGIGAAVLYTGKRVLDILDKLVSPMPGVTKILDSVQVAITNVGNAFAGIGTSIKNVFVSIETQINNIGKAYASSLKTKANAEFLKSLAIALLVLVGGLVVLSQIPVNDLIKGGIALGLCAAALIIMMVAIRKMMMVFATLSVDPKFFTSFAMGFIGITVALLLIATLASKLTKVPWSSLAKGAVVIVAFLLTMQAVLHAAVKVPPRHIEKVKDIAKGMFAIEGCLLVMALVAKALNKVEGWSILKLFGIIANFILVMAALLVLRKKFKTGIDDMVPGLFKMVSTILLMAIVAKVAGYINVGDFGNLILISFIFEAVVLTMGMVADLIKESNLNELAPAINSIIGSIFLLSVLTLVLGLLNPANIGIGLGAILGIELLIYTLIRLVDKAGGKIDEVGPNLMGIAKVIALLAGVVFVIGKMRFVDMAQGVIAVGVIELLIVALIKLTAKAGGEINNVGPNLMKIAGAIAIIAIVARVIGGMDPAKFYIGLAGVAAIGLLIVGLMALFKLVGKIKEPDAKAKTIFDGLPATFLAMALAVKILSTISWESLGPGLVGIVVLTVIVGALAWFISSKAGSNAPKLATTLAGLAIAIGMLAVVAALLGILPLDMILKGVGAVFALSVAMAIMVVACKGAADARKTIMGVVAAIIAMAVVVALLSMIDDTEALQRAAVSMLLMGVCFAIMALALNTVEGSWGKVGMALVMVLAIAAIAGALMIIQDIPTNTLYAGAVALGGVLIALSVALAILGSIKNVDFKAILGVIALSAALIVVSAALSLLAGVPWQTLLAGAAALGVMIAALALFGVIGPPLGTGIAIMVAGLLGLSVAIIIVVGAMYLLGPALEGIAIGMEALVATAAKLEPQMEAFKSVMSTVGTECLIFLLKLAAGLVVAGLAIVVFAALAGHSLGGLVAFGIGLLVVSVAIMVLAAAFAVLGGAFELAGAGIAVLADTFSFAMVEIAAGWAVLKEGSISAGTEMLKGFGEAVNSEKKALYDTVYDTGEVVSEGLEDASADVKQVGENVAENVANSMEDMAESVADSSDEMKDAVTTAAEGAGGEVKVEAKVTPTVPDKPDEEAKKSAMDYFSNLFSGDGMNGLFAGFGEGLLGSITDMFSGKGFKDIMGGFLGGDDTGESTEGGEANGAAWTEGFLGGISGIPEEIKGMISGEGLSEMIMGEGGQFDFMSMISGGGEGMSIGNFQVDQASLDTTIATSLTTTTENNKANAEAVGKALAGSTGDGFTSGLTTLTGAITNTTNKAAAANTDTAKNAGNTLGENVVDGFANSFTSGESIGKVSSGMTALVDAAYAAGQKASDSHSPSKRFYKLGDFCVQGLNNAFEDGAPSIAGTVYKGMNFISDTAKDVLLGADLSKEAGSMMQDAISKTMSILDGADLSSPVITPVLNLDEIQNGMGSIDTMFSTRRAMSLNTEFSTRSSDIGSINDTLSKLALSMGQTKAGGDTYIINGVSYEESSDVSEAMKTLVRAAKVERRI